MGKPVLNYFAIAGRGELARLVAAAGELEIEDKLWDPAFDDTGGWRQGYQAIGKEYGMPGTLPILVHDELDLHGEAIFQSQAIENYLSSIAPKFECLTPQQRAKDLMFALTKADINASTESLLFKKITPEDLVPIIDKWYPIVEGLLPEEGFINGLEFPTMADLSVLLICYGCMPFQAAPTIAGCAFKPEKYPKMQRISKACAAYPPVAAYLAASPTLMADPFSIMPAEYKASLA